MNHGAYATGFNKENNEKKYEWMREKSYFAYKERKIKTREERLWNFLEVKPYNSIIKQYIKAVEDEHLKARYTAPKWQSIGVQILRVFGK